MIFFFLLASAAVVMFRSPPAKQINTQVSGREPVDITPHLTEFTKVIRRGHKPHRWLVNNAIDEACRKGNWRLVESISQNFLQYDPALDSIGKPKSKAENTEKLEESEKTPEQLDKGVTKVKFNVDFTTSPIEGISDEDWRMFVETSRSETEDFSTDSSVGMFRQNRKRLAKLGINDIGDPISQYDAFEKEVSQLMQESTVLVKDYVAMPVVIDGDSVPITLSGLLSVMRIAGTKNAEKWLTSEDERKRFPNTTDAFKRSNGCF